MDSNTAQLQSEPEEWRDIPIVPGYQVSSHGRVRGKSRPIINNGRMYIKRGAMCSLQTDEDGYVFVRINPQGKHAIKDEEGNAKTRKYYVHILVAAAFIGPAPFPGVEVDHKNRVRNCNRPWNLHYVTRLENAQNRVLNPARGEKSNFAKLTEEQVKVIKERIKLGATNKTLSEEYGVSPNTIGKIRSGKSWTHIT